MRATKATFAVLGLTTILAGGVVGGVGTAHAAERCEGGYPPAQCTVEVDHDRAERGEDIGFGADGYEPGEQADGEVHSTVVRVGTWTANAQGVVNGTFAVPSSLSTGTHTFVLTGRSSGVVKTISFTVTGKAAGSAGTVGSVSSSGSGSSVSSGSGSLPRTGAEVAGLVGGGAALVLVGGALVVATTRRKRANAAV